MTLAAIPAHIAMTVEIAAVPVITVMAIANGPVITAVFVFD